MSNSKEHEAGDECLTCALVAARDRGAAPDWDAIYRTAHWDIVHALNSHLLGWICIVTRKHHHAIADVEARAMAEVQAEAREEAVRAMEAADAKAARQRRRRHEATELELK